MTAVIVLTVFSIAFLILFLMFSFRSYKRLILNRHINAEIVRYYCEKDSDSGMNYYPVLRFKNDHDQWVIAISPDSMSQKTLTIGSVVTVSYDPLRPKHAPILSWTDNYLPQIVLAIFATVTTWGAIVNWLRLM